MPGLVMGYVRVEQTWAEGREVAFFHDAWPPMPRPDGNLDGMLIAVALFALGVAALVLRGERPADPDGAAG